MLQITELLEPKPSPLWRLVKQAGVDEVVTLLDGGEQKTRWLKKDAQSFVPVPSEVPLKGERPWELAAYSISSVFTPTMTPDAEMAKLLGTVAAAGARAIVVGDYRQLDAVGPGGALEALARRHPGRVFALTENVRQADPAERHALDQLRAGEVPMAASWYVLNGRVHPAPTQGQALLDMVRAWAYDVVEGKDALLVAYHRDAVEALNGAARLVWEELGYLSGPSSK